MISKSPLQCCSKASTLGFLQHEEHGGGYNGFEIVRHVGGAAECNPKGAKGVVEVLG
jgi:hypothetical protein